MKKNEKKIIEKKNSKTYIKGFDKLLNGGFPKGFNILISGTYGSGKTIFSLEYLYNGAKNNEIGIYFTFEEKRESLFEQAKNFGWDLEELEKKGLIKIIQIGINEISNHTINEIIEILKNTSAQRCVIDSITTLSYITPENSSININKYSIRKFLYAFITKFTELKNLTTIFISQKDEIESNLISKYLCDGVIEINFESMGGDYSRTIQIQKMRKTKNDEGFYPLEIKSNEGIIIHEL